MPTLVEALKGKPTVFESENFESSSLHHDGDIRIIDQINSDDLRSVIEKNIREATQAKKSTK